MKTKNVILGAAAFTLAAGAAVASVLVNPVFVRVNEANPTPTQQVNQDLCQTTGAAVCRVQVIKSGVTETRTAYSNAAGTTALRNSTSATVIPPTPIVIP